jgi:hypothetical protein
VFSLRLGTGFLNVISMNSCFRELKLIVYCIRLFNYTVSNNIYMASNEVAIWS